MTKPLGGRAALITGGAAGIGRATAEALAAAGADVGIVDLDQGKATATIQAITTEYGVKGTHAMADVADEADARAAHAAITDAGSGAGLRYAADRSRACFRIAGLRSCEWAGDRLRPRC